ncbi:MAG: hypothetical protein ACE5JU_25810, partial [Candidatus Binatia bacterium]
GKVKRQFRSLTIRFHATDDELAQVHHDLEGFIDRLVFDEMGLSPRTINLIRMMRGQVAVSAGFIKREDYELSVKDFKLDSNRTGW